MEVRRGSTGVLLICVLAVGICGCGVSQFRESLLSGRQLAEVEKWCRTGTFDKVEGVEVPMVTPRAESEELVQLGFLSNDKRIVPYLALLIVRYHKHVVSRTKVSVDLPIESGEYGFVKVFVVMEGVPADLERGYLSGRLVEWIKANSSRYMGYKALESELE